LQAKHEADKAPSVVFPDPRQQSKKARKKALEGVGQSQTQLTSAPTVCVNLVLTSWPLAASPNVIHPPHPARAADLLMLPNTNAAMVKGAELQRRQEDAAKAAAKRERDKNDLKKQKEDAVKKAADRTKRAAKVERRA